MTEQPGFDTYHKDHWVEIEPDRFDRYEQLFRLDDKRGDAVLGSNTCQTSTLCSPS